MTAKQTLDKLHRYLTLKEDAAWRHLSYCKDTYGEDSDETRKARAVWSELSNMARAVWSELSNMARLIEHPERIDEHLNIWEEPND